MKIAILDNRSYVEYDVSDMDWEIDEDYLQDRVSEMLQWIWMVRITYI